MVTNGLDRETRGYARVAIYSCLLNTALVGGKYFLGHVSGSQALIADAVHSLADLVASLSIFVGIVISGRKTRTFPHGLYKVENLVALLCSFFIFFAAYEIVEEALFGPPTEGLQHIPLVVGGLLVIMASVYLFSRYELKVGQEARSPTLVADAKQLTTDLLSYVVILGGIVATYLGLRIDRYVAVFVALLVVKMGFEILVDSLKVLLEATLDYRTLDGIRKIVEAHPEVREVQDLRGRNSGRFKFVELTLTTDLKLLHRAHSLTETLESQIRESFPNIDQILIHYEPEHKEAWLIAVPVQTDDGSLNEQSGIGEHFGGAEQFALLLQNTHTGETRIHELLENPHSHLDRKKGIKAAELLQQRGIDRVFTRTGMDGQGSAYALEGMGIEMFTTGAETIGELVKDLERNFTAQSRADSAAETTQR
jgi:cation diffusion facilitator family transporter